MKRFKRIFVLWCVMCSLSCSMFAFPTNVVYLIPKDFTGGVIIIYDQPDGITPETTADGTIIYRVPQDGLLKVKNKFERRNFRFKYYFVDDKDNRTEIEYLHPETYVRDPGDTTSKRESEITDDERNNKVFLMSHETQNFNSREGRVFLHSFIVEKPVNSLKTFMRNQDKIFNIQRETLGIKEKSILYK